MQSAILRKPLLGVMMVLALAFAAFGAAGCGDDENTSASTSSEETTMQTDSMASEGVEVGGAMMTPDRDIVANASDASNVTTLVDLVGKAGLVKTLQGDGPYTVFAPDNDAFGELPKKTVASLQEAKNKDQLAAILTYHVVPEELDAAKLTKYAEDGETITTVQGEKLTPKVEGGKVMIEDASGNTVEVTQADVKSSNGVTHIINGVLMPQS